ncbi:hypothetical protein VP01_1483g9 [Puccinia sorghi]|uniref:Uncharacterized protein n=1 Tax=Puccinia sorghi TaxID=27349 RepID=A0A0L6VJN7_9BASI|nr:hypothetical protein VP01_1483g9 [Puccinia sorghi]
MFSLNRKPTHDLYIEKTIRTSKSNPDKNAVGRLISIAEIIKRNFASSSTAGHRPPKRQKTGAHEPHCVSSNSLHQYNEYGSLECLILERAKSIDISPEDRQAALLARQAKIIHEFLDEERKRPRQSHTPWLKIYLWPTEIRALQNLANVSYQPPLVPENPAEDELSLTNEILPASGLSALPPTLVNPQEEILEEECDLAPI